jgi:hypothetical protein
MNDGPLCLGRLGGDMVRGRGRRERTRQALSLCSVLRHKCRSVSVWEQRLRGNGGGCVEGEMTDGGCGALGGSRIDRGSCGDACRQSACAGGVGGSLRMKDCGLRRAGVWAWAVVGGGVKKRG